MESKERLDRMVAGPDERTELPEALSYARRVTKRWSRFQLTIAVVCGIAWLFLSISTAEVLYAIPGERYLFGEPTDIGDLGLISALGSPIILMLSAFTRSRAVIAAAAGLVVLAIIWAIRVIVLLSYL